MYDSLQFTRAISDMLTTPERASTTLMRSSGATLMADPGRVYGRGQLLDAVWGSSDYRDPRTIDVHVRHLREKIEGDPAQPERLLTVRGVGYRFTER